MTSPDEGQKGSPRERFRNILSAEQEDEPAREPRKPTVVNLPKLGNGGLQPIREDPVHTDGGPPGAEGNSASRYLRTFWTVGGFLSVIANAVLLLMLLGGRSLAAPGAADSVLTAAYMSLEQLENAHIRTAIPLRTTLALDPMVPITGSTRITLARDLFVRGAHVTINGGGLSIDSPADITLPAGTELDVNIDLALLLQTGLPVTADVPVDIAVRDTELHAAIQGLKDSLRQVVCARSAGAVMSDGTPICR
jgi:hypothetical protein